MGARLGGVTRRVRSGRTWLRSRGPVTLAAAILLEVSSATPRMGPNARGLLRAALLAFLLLGVLIAAAVDALATWLLERVLVGWARAARWTRANVLGLPAPAEIPDALLLDRSGRPLRGGARAARIAALTRARQELMRARSLRGRAAWALAWIQARSGPLAHRVALRALAFESRVLAARAAFLAQARNAARWARPRAARALGAGRIRALVLWREIAARVAPLRATSLATLRTLRAGVRREGAALTARTAAAMRGALRVAALGVALSRAGIRAVPVVPLPGMSLRTLRVVTVGVLLSFVFATAIGTTGLIATRGSVALGASTSLAIIAGEVSVLEPGAAEFRAGFDGDVLAAGSTIKTGPESYAVLTYFEGSTVSIDPDTVLVIEALQANPDGSTVIAMRQDVGRTWHAVTKILTAESKYEVRTAGATATVRGTLFLVGVQPSAELGVPETIIETTEGAVAAEREPTPEAPEGEEIVVLAGFQVKATESAPIPPPVPAPEPERKVTVTVGTGNAVVLDPQGRANGEVNGRIVVQTPGATVEKIDGKVVVTLPNTSDGKISTVIQPPPAEDDDDDAPPPPPAPVQVITVVEERGKGESRTEETVQRTTQPTVTGVEVKKADDQTAPSQVRPLEEREKREAPKVKVAKVPGAELVALVREGERDRGRDGDRGERGAGQGGERGGTGEDGEASGNGGEDGDSGEGSGEGEGDREEKPTALVNAIVTLTLPPLSREEIAKREEQKREAEEREKRDREKRDAERRKEAEVKVAALRQAEGQARANADRIGEDRQREEGRRDERRQEEDRRVEEGRRQEERGAEQPAAPVAVLQQIVTAFTPQNETRREEDRRVDELRKAEEEAKKQAEKAAEERRRAEQRLREDAIKAEEEKRKEAVKRAEELRKAEEKAKEQAEKRAEELRKAEEKAREQAATLADEQRKQAEKLLEEFRKAEEKAREQAAKQLEEQRKSEERAREDAERKLRELRREEEQARESERERERARDEERGRGAGGFVPNVQLKPAPTVGGRSLEADQRSQH